MFARLILTTGSRAGLVAVLHDGVYLVGRDKLCQIRPKSRSVSRKHCAIFNDSQTLKVLDLGSTSGTRINGEKISPRKRVELHDGDQIRCGKITFSVSLDLTSQPGAEAPFPLHHSHENSQPESLGEDEHTMITGAALRESDIADLLVHLDEVDRADRIAEIRHRHEVEEQKAAEFADAVLEAEDLDTDPQAILAERAAEHDRHGHTLSGDETNSRYKKLDAKTKRSIASRLRRKEGTGFDPQKLAVAFISIALFAVFVWVIWSNYDLFFGEPMAPKDLDY